MNRTNFVPAIIAVVIMGGLLGTILFSTRKNHLDLKGEILKVRVQTIEQENEEGKKVPFTIAVLDFRVNNPSTQQFVVKNLDVALVTKDGKTLEPGYFAELDAQRMFEYYKTIGKQYNPTLMARDKIEAGQQVDRMIALRFNAPEEEINSRKKLVMTIEDVDGAKAEITEKR